MPNGGDAEQQWIERVAARAPELTGDQVSTLRSLLGPNAQHQRETAAAAPELARAA